MKILEYFKISYESSKQDGTLLSDLHKPIKLGLRFALVVFLVVFVWGGLAPLKSAAIAHGKLIISDQNKVIQHLEGGVIEEILVKDGDKVKANQPLIVLNSSSSGAQLQMLKLEANELMAADARLTAERDKKEEIDFSRNLESDLPSDELQRVIDTQTEIFNTRRRLSHEKESIMYKKSEQLKSEVSGLQAQRAAVGKSLSVANDELAIYKELFSKRGVSKMKVIELEKEVSSYQGEAARISSDIAKVNQTVEENELARMNLKTEEHEEVMKEYKENQQKLADVNEKLRAITDVYSRAVIKAPVAGVVNGLKTHTVGGVVPPGAELMQIVPESENVIIEAQLDPKDIDLVHEDLEATVRLTAFKGRTAPPLSGKVTYISADTFTDERTRASHYNINVTLEKLPEEFEKQLQPGMTAEVYITTGRRTFLSYLMDPITTTMHKAFKED